MYIFIVLPYYIVRFAYNFYGMIRVNKNTLYAFSCVFWLFAGAKVFNTGINNCLNYRGDMLYIVVLSLIVFSVFHFLIFKKVLAKNKDFVFSLKGEKHSPIYMMSFKQYLIVVFMIVLGICVRKFHLLDNFIIAFFYTGLGLALLFTGVRFLLLACKKQNC